MELKYAMSSSPSLASSSESTSETVEMSELQKSKSNSNDITDCNSTVRTSQDPVLYVKEARLDPELLVRYVTRCAAKVAKKQFCTSSNRNKKNRRRERRKHPYEDAIQFDLSISFNGRKYTATRTLPSFIQLRNDLIRESHNGKKRQQQQEEQEQQKQEQQQDEEEEQQCEQQHVLENVHEKQEQQKSFSNSYSSFVNIETSNSVKTSATDAEVDEILIPELPLPPLSDEESVSTSPPTSSTATSVASSGTARDSLTKNTISRNTSSTNLTAAMTNTSMAIMAGGFRMLHAIIKSYCPALERWLRHIVRLFPDSPALTHFLWEPLGGSVLLQGVQMLLQPPPMPTRNSFSRKSSSGTLGSSLGSIQEMEKESSDEEEESEGNNREAQVSCTIGSKQGEALIVKDKR